MAGVEVEPVAIAAETILALHGQYCGITVRESGGSTAVVTLYDGIDTSGPIIEEVSLVASESTRENYPRPGRLVKSGKITIAITGTVQGSVFI